VENNAALQLNIVSTGLEYPLEESKGQPWH